MNDTEIKSRLIGYVKQINNEINHNYKLLYVINLLEFLNQEKDWINKQTKDRNMLKKVIEGKIKEFNEIIKKSNGRYYKKLINLFHKKSNLFCKSSNY